MNQLEAAIQKAFQLSGATNEANKAYIAFVNANFLIPVEKYQEGTEPVVLFLKEGGHAFLPVFTEKSYLDEWAFDIKDTIDILRLTGVNLLKGIGEDVFVSLNIGTPFYKEFNPSEIARMRSLILKFFKD